MPTSFRHHPRYALNKLAGGVNLRAIRYCALHAAPPCSHSLIFLVARTPSLFIHLKIFVHINIDGGGRVLIKTWLSYQRWSRGLAHGRELVEERYVIVREEVCLLLCRSDNDTLIANPTTAHSYSNWRTEDGNSSLSLIGPCIYSTTVQFGACVDRSF